MMVSWLFGTGCGSRPWRAASPARASARKVALPFPFRCCERGRPTGSRCGLPQAVSGRA